MNIQLVGSRHELGRTGMTWARPASPPQEPNEFSQARALAKSHETVQQHLAARTVASHAVDATECERLLAMLGLDAVGAVSARRGTDS
jgi:hypothetical protein